MVDNIDPLAALHINWSKAVLKTCLPLQTTAHLQLDNISFEDLCTLEDLILEG